MGPYKLIQLHWSIEQIFQQEAKAYAFPVDYLKHVELARRVFLDPPPADLFQPSQSYRAQDCTADLAEIMEELGIGGELHSNVAFADYGTRVLKK